MSGLSILNVHKAYPGVQALVGVSFDVHPEEVVALLGPSGCGKSTLLNVIAGLETPDRGAITWDGEDLANIPVHRRGFGLMFQDYALFPHKNVFENVAFGLRMANDPDPQLTERVTQVLELIGLPGFEQRDVNTLSGGEAQRVALARSLAPRPHLLMLDEPLGSLDRNLRERLVADLREILRTSKQTAIYVTHDQEEAFAIADRVVLMNRGKVEQVDTPLKMYRQPHSVFTARFLGLTNLMEGQILCTDGKYVVLTRIGRFPIDQEMLVHGPEMDRGSLEAMTSGAGNATILLRPDRVQVGMGAECHLEGTVIESTFRGSMCQAVIEVNGENLRFDFLSSAQIPGIGEPVCIEFDPSQAMQIFLE